MSKPELTRRTVDTGQDALEATPWIERLPRSVGMLLVFVIGVGVWQGIFALRLLPPIILPSPGETFRELWTVGTNLVTGGYMLDALWITTQEVLLGFLLAVAIGFVLGLIVGRKRRRTKDHHAVLGCHQRDAEGRVSRRYSSHGSDSASSRRSRWPRLSHFSPSSWIRQPVYSVRITTRCSCFAPWEPHGGKH